MITLLLTKWLGEKGLAVVKAILSSKYTWIALGLLFIIGFSAYKGYSYEKAKYEATIAKIQQASKAQHDVDQKAIQSNQLDSILLESKVKEIQGDSNEQIAKANATTNDALHALSLQQRAHRPTKGDDTTSNSPTTQPTTYSTGRGLFNEDAAFLTRDAGQTQLLVIKFNQCVDSYNKVRDNINSQKQTVLP